MVSLLEQLTDKNFVLQSGFDDCKICGDIDIADNDRIENGMVYCGTCGQPKLTATTLSTGATILFPVVCSHEVNMQATEIAHKACFAGEWARVGRVSTFDQADADTPRDHMLIAKSYVDNYVHGKGLMLYGMSGRGKTFLAACICNALIDTGHKCKMTSVHSLITQMFDAGENKVLAKLKTYDVVVLDDFGVEKLSGYNLEKTYTIVDTLYKAYVSTIITTNLTKPEIDTPRKEYARVIERLKERCERYEIAGTNRRQGRIPTC